MSGAVSPWLAMRGGSSHRRMEYWRSLNIGRGHARNPLEGVGDVEIEIVAEEQAVVLAVFGVDACAENKLVPDF